MGLQSISCGNHAVKEVLENFLCKKRLPAVSLFYGPPGSGKSFFASHFIQDVLCISPVDIYCCNSCPSCKTVKALTSPDLLKISSNDGSSVKIEDIKKAQEFSSLQPVYSDRKMIWIEDAHLLTIEAFNSILKILEEPNQTTNFLLTTSKLDSILPTVRSRSTTIPFSYYTEAEIKQILLNNQCDEPLSELLSKIGNGNIKKALSYMDPVNFENRKNQVEYFFKMLEQPSILIPYQSKEEILSFIATSQTLFQDMSQMKLLSNQACIINKDYWESLTQFSGKVALSEMIKISEILINAEIDLNRVNVNLKAYFEMISLAIKNIVLFC